MATFTKFYAFSEAIAEGIHDLDTHALTVALFAAANAPSASADSVLADIGSEVSYTYCSSRVLVVSSSSQTAGVYKLVLADLVLTASGGAVGPFRYIVIFNDTATSDPLIGYYDYGSDLTLADGDSLTLDFSATNGLIQIT